MSEQDNDGPVEWMEKLVGDWLPREDWRPELLAWLEGARLPPVGHDDEPYLWVLRGLPEGDRRAAAERTLGERVAALLREQPDVRRSGRWPEQALYNLLMLAAGLAFPEILAEPLHAMFERRAVEGAWLGLGLRHSLREALAANQLDARLLSEWQGMLEGRSGSFLPGYPRDGYAGVLKMPESPEKLGSPSVNALGGALARMAAHLKDKQDRREQFRGLVSLIYHRYYLVPDRYQWAGLQGHPFDRDLLLQADQHRWPKWAVDCLPSHCIVLQDDEPVRMLVSCVYLAALPDRYQIKGKLCGGQVLDVTMLPNTARGVVSMATVADPERRRVPWPSDRAVAGLLSDVMVGLELRWSESEPWSAPCSSDRSVGADSSAWRAKHFNSVDPLDMVRQTGATLRQQMGL